MCIRSAGHEGECLFKPDPMVMEVVKAARAVRSQSYDGDAFPTLQKRLKALDDALAKVPYA